MRKIIKNILAICLVLLPMLVRYTSANNIAPTYRDNFSKFFTSSEADSNGEVIDVYNISGVSADKSLMENIRCLFYPNSNTRTECHTDIVGGKIRGVLRYLGYALVVLFIVIAGIRLLVSGSNAENVKPALMSLLYIIIGAILFFGSVWILGSVLDINSAAGTKGLLENIHGDESSLLFFFLSFMKALAFFAAIFMMTVHGFKMMSNSDKSDKVKAGLKGLLNVIVALVIIKMIDYIYYIVQLPDMVEKTTDLIVEIAKIVGFIIGALMVIMLFYAGILFITDQGNSEKMKKATNIIVGILVSAVVIFALLLIIYEIFNEFVNP